MDKNDIKKQSTHEEICKIPATTEKWMAAGQAMLQEPTGRHPLFVTTVFCKFCGHVKLNIAGVDLPTPPSVTVPRAEVRA